MQPIRGGAPMAEKIGYTNDPTADIKAHRRNAHWTRVFGVAGFIIAAGYTIYTGEVVGIFVGLAWGGWANWAATDLEKQAAEWEGELG